MCCFHITHPSCRRPASYLSSRSYNAKHHVTISQLSHILVDYVPRIFYTYYDAFFSLIIQPCAPSHSLSWNYVVCFLKIKHVTMLFFTASMLPHHICINLNNQSIDFLTDLQSNWLSQYPIIIQVKFVWHSFQWQ